MISHEQFFTKEEAVDKLGASEIYTYSKLTQEPFSGYIFHPIYIAIHQKHLNFYFIPFEGKKVQRLLHFPFDHTVEDRYKMAMSLSECWDSKNLTSAYPINQDSDNYFSLKNFIPSDAENVIDNEPIHLPQVFADFLYVLAYSDFFQRSPYYESLKTFLEITFPVNAIYYNLQYLFLVNILGAKDSDRKITSSDLIRLQYNATDMVTTPIDFDIMRRLATERNWFSLKTKNEILEDFPRLESFFLSAYRKHFATNILFLAANIHSKKQLNLGKELREITDALKFAPHREQLFLSSLWQIRPQDIRRAMLDYRPEIVHFSGHGGLDDDLKEESNTAEHDSAEKPERGAKRRAKLADIWTAKGNIFLVDNEDNPRPYSAEELGEALSSFSQNLRCLVLNGCFTFSFITTLSKYIPHIIATIDTISDTSAIDFARGFYDAIGAGEKYEKAFRLGRKAIGWDGKGDKEWMLVMATRDFTTKRTQLIMNFPSNYEKLYTFLGKMDIDMINIEQKPQNDTNPLLGRAEFSDIQVKENKQGVPLSLEIEQFGSLKSKKIIPIQNSYNE